ncbi:hypothetical protein MMC11_004346 [Xylographa trunciseda]|nr:hypothetical protein [Xylographa trunciseda]
MDRLAALNEQPEADISDACLRISDLKSTEGNLISQRDLADRRATERGTEISNLRGQVRDLKDANTGPLQAEETLKKDLAKYGGKSEGLDNLVEYMAAEQERLIDEFKDKTACGSQNSDFLTEARKAAGRRPFTALPGHHPEPEKTTTGNEAEAAMQQAHHTFGKRLERQKADSEFFLSLSKGLLTTAKLDVETRTANAAGLRRRISDLKTEKLAANAAAEATLQAAHETFRRHMNRRCANDYKEASDGLAESSQKLRTSVLFEMQAWKSLNKANRLQRIAEQRAGVAERQVGTANKRVSAAVQELSNVRSQLPDAITQGVEVKMNALKDDYRRVLTKRISELEAKSKTKTLAKIETGLVQEYREHLERIYQSIPPTIRAEACGNLLKKGVSRNTCTRLRSERNKFQDNINKLSGDFETSKGAVKAALKKARQDRESASKTANKMATLRSENAKSSRNQDAKAKRLQEQVKKTEDALRVAQHDSKKAKKKLSQLTTEVEEAHKKAQVALMVDCEAQTTPEQPTQVAQKLDAAAQTTPETARAK